MDFIIDNVIAIRKLKGLKQKDVAEQIGMAQSNYSRIEKAQSDITLSRLDSIAHVFGMDVEDLIRWQAPNESDVKRVMAKRKRLEKKRDKLISEIDNLEDVLKLKKGSLKGVKHELKILGTPGEVQLW